jgi:septum formation protein
MLLNILNEYKILLGSQSPRRKQLIEGAGIPFTLVPPIDIDESYPDSLKGKDIPIYLAVQKATAYQSYLIDDKTILVTADTIVWLNGSILGKPKDKADAISMLQLLSGKKHVVYTGVCIKMKHKTTTFYAETDVYFRKLSDAEIEYYVNAYKPYDKAGSYGAQEWVGYVGIDKIKGSYFNVMGLPIQKLYLELEKMIKN